MMNAVNARIKIYPVDDRTGFYRHAEDRKGKINACGFFTRLISEYVMLIIRKTGLQDLRSSFPGSADV